ncbi:MAG: DNA helicase UvrD [Candidatus Methanomethylicota archaeon]|nr:MAG: DNA helicase UvrD [Candidatus Verstraetearchaeota archaeon]
MKIYADLHVHSRFSGGTSKDMTISKLSQFAKLKGLNVLGTGDAFHPSWLKELKLNLEESQYEGLYVNPLFPQIYFIVECEVGTLFEFKGKIRRVHHVILMPSLDVAEQISDMLSFYGEIAVDGRPVFKMHPSELIDLTLSVDENCFIFPAHAWTPWWSIFGAFSGVNRIEDCYGDRSDKIYAIETGLSSDPSMNWRISWLHKYSLVSFSDAHSPWPFRLGREACVFNLDRLSYSSLISAIKDKDPKRFLMTIEVEPAYGKYHWSGHRKCGVGPIPPEEARKLNYICPVCGRKLTKGVEDRVEELADLPAGYVPENSIPFIKLLPLQQIIASALGVNSNNISNLYSKRIWNIYLELVSHFGSEFSILLEASINKLAEFSPPIAFSIKRIREGKYRVIPGYDGVYGEILLNSNPSHSIGEYII